jgi:hypothetical protein
MKLGSFLSEVFATVAGGMILAFLLFAIKEWFFPLPRITGRWFFETRCLTTSYKPFSGMILRYVAMIWQEGTLIHGTFEKTYELSSTGERDYVGNNRVRGTLEGHIAKFYLTRDKVYMHLVEEGVQRSSSTVFELVKKGSSEMSGVFHSTAADQSGIVSWQHTKDT